MLEFAACITLYSGVLLFAQYSRTALHLAAERGHATAVDALLLLKCDVNKNDKVGDQN